MMEKRLIQEIRQAFINFTIGQEHADFARESGSLKSLEAIYRVAMWRYRYFLRGLR